MPQIYFNPSCSKSRAALTLLDEHGIKPEVIRYLETAPTRADLERLMALLGIDDPRAMMRTGEAAYRELQLDGATRDELLDAVSSNPILLERPIVVRGDMAVIGRPPERVLELLS
jgi:arsenate reductase (glutaredoxin)